MMTNGFDVLLINARSRSGGPGYLPYGLLYIAAVLRENDFRVRIWDKNVDNQDLGTILSQCSPKIVGISVLTGPVILDAIEISRAIKREFNDIKVVWGGLHPTLFPQSVLAEEYVDYVVLGEGEYPLLELVEFLSGDKHRLEDIANLGYKVGREIRLNKMREFIDLDKLPMPAWDLVDMNKYYIYRFYAKRTVTMNTSRGCPFRCSFCYNQAINKRRWRGISAGKVAEQIRFIKDKYHIQGILFYEDDFEANRKRLQELCNILINEKMGITFEHYSRVNYAKEERLALEREAGLKLISYGVESGSPRMLEFIKKDQTVAQIQEAFQICDDLGIAAAASFMIGLPTETIEELNSSMSLANSLHAHNIFPMVYTPYPGTELFDYCINEKLFELPAILADQGRAYTADEANINVSPIPSKYLEQVKARLFLYNRLNEVKACIKYKNYRTLSSYVKSNAFEETKLIFKSLGRCLRG